jgi:creatinine amidohydrolase
MLIMKEMPAEHCMEILNVKKTVIIPLGAYEIYGPHLPVGTDIIVAEEVAHRISEKLGLVVGPSISVGESSALYDFPGTLNISPSAFYAYLEDICRSFMKWGVDKIFYMNTHLGNVPIIGQLAWKLNDEGVKSCQVDWWRFIQPVCREGVTDHDGVMCHGHASEAGTSCMLYLRPDLVDMSKATVVEPQYKDDYPDIIKYIELKAYTADGTIGDAKAATAEKGKIIVEKGITRIVEFLKEYFGL